MHRELLAWTVLLALGFAPGCGSGSGGQTITGSVLTANASAAGLVVGILSNGNLQSVAVNGDGSFSVTGVTLPYDAMVADPTVNAVNVFQGLTVAHPTVSAPDGTASTTSRRSTLQGSVTASPGLTLAGYEVITLGFVSTLGSTQLENGLGAPDRTFNMPISWSGPATVAGDLYVITNNPSANPLTPLLLMGSRCFRASP